jgi:plastocyanin domain-containing protein
VTLPEGYKDNNLAVKAGKPVALTFFLKSDAGCGNTVKVPDAKWQKTLKIGEKATVVYTPKKSGKLAFACGMDHMKGSVIVK